MTIKVLIVDDSLLMRKLLSELLAMAPDIEVVGTASDAQQARDKIKQLNPDVLTLDVNMPGMDGLDFLERLMRLRPMPVVMVSALTGGSTDTTLRALELGAVDFIGKPKMDGSGGMAEYAQELVDKVRTAKSAHVHRPLATPPAAPARSAPREAPGQADRIGIGKIIFVGASTGGTEAIKEFLTAMPAGSPPILITQHMPESFTRSFAQRLDSLCAVDVIEAQGGETLQHGMAYIAPGHSHLLVRRKAGGYATELSSEPPVNRHRPAVDVLFNSAAREVGKSAVAVILTGMGKDGAQGMLAMRRAGARTYGQDEASCVVYGMPREAFMVGAVETVVGLQDMARRVVADLQGKR